jgi:cell volume regulation protein A
MLYFFQVDQAHREETVAQFIVKQFHGKPVVGDWVRFGPVKFIVREMKGDQISSVGLKLH